MSDPPAPRRRRSVALTPALLDPAELPEDAVGRVALIAITVPDDVNEGDDPGAPPEHEMQEPGKPGMIDAFLAAGSGWVPAAVVAALITVLFIVGVLLTR